MTRALAAVMLLAGAASLPAQTTPPVNEGLRFGVGIAYAEFWTSYYGNDGTVGFYPYIAWSQVQVAGFFETRGPFRVGERQSRVRVEARLGYGGAEDDGTTNTSAGTSLTDGGASLGLGAFLRLPLTRPGGSTSLYVGAGLDLAILGAFGNDGSSYFSKGWVEYLVTLPLVAGVHIARGRLVISPELRYAPFGTSSTDLEPPSSGGVDAENMPTALMVMVSINRR